MKLTVIVFPMLCKSCGGALVSTSGFMFTFGFGPAILSYKNKSEKGVPYLFPYSDLSDDGTMAFRDLRLYEPTA